MSDPRIPLGAALMVAGSILINKLLPIPRWAYLDRVKRRQEKRAQRMKGMVG